MRIKSIFLLFFCLIAFVQCNDNDEHYEEPGWLEPPLYSVLKEKGNFTNYLQCIDRTAYAPVIAEGGYYTLLAPNDDAFAVYLRENGYSSVEEIPQDVVEQIVSYSMLFGRIPLSHMGDVFINSGDRGEEYPTDDDGFMKNVGVKKKTNYYPIVYQDPDFDNNWVLDQNSRSGTYNSSTHSYKYIPIVTSFYFDAAGLTRSDYETVFPNATYTRYNVIDGHIIEGTDADYDGMRARNGIAHEVSKVSLPLDNMDKYLMEAQYAQFKGLLDFKDISGTYVYKAYTQEQNMAEFYKIVKPEYKIETAYIKSYNSEIAFSPVYELFESSSIENEMDGYTLFVPTNEALNDYIENKILKYYDNINDLPIEVITTLINTHMVEGMVWPSKLKTYRVSTGEFINGLGANGGGYQELNVHNPRVTSNGFIYTIDHVIKSKLFETVYGEIFLNPEYSMLNNAFVKWYASTIRESLMTSVLSGDDTPRYTTVLLSDDILKDDGYSYDSDNDSFSNSGVLSGTADNRLQRLMRMHIFQGYINGGIDTEVKSFEGGDVSFYNGFQYRVSVYGDVVRYRDNQLEAAGNIEDGTKVEVRELATTVNGTVYEITNGQKLEYSPKGTYPTTEEGWAPRTLWETIQKAGTEPNNSVSTFMNYVQTVLLDDDGALSGISDDNSYTVLAVNNTYMVLAQNTRDDQGNRLLPTIAEINGDATGVLADKAAAFLRSHFLQGRIVPDDGLNYLFPYNSNSPNSDLLPTMNRITNEDLGLINQRTYVTVSKEVDGKLLFHPENVPINTTPILVSVDRSVTPNGVDRSGLRNQTDNFKSNRMGGNCIMHEIAGYFYFEEMISE